MSFPEPQHLRRQRQRNPNTVKPKDLTMKALLKPLFRFLYPFLANWKTSIAGVGMILSGSATIVHEVAALASGGAPDLEIISMAAGTVVGGIGLVAGRDADKSTEQSR